MWGTFHCPSVRLIFWGVWPISGPYSAKDQHPGWVSGYQVSGHPGGGNHTLYALPFCSQHRGVPCPVGLHPEEGAALLEFLPPAADVSPRLTSASPSAELFPRKGGQAPSMQQRDMRVDPNSCLRPALVGQAPICLLVPKDLSSWLPCMGRAM